MLVHVRAGEKSIPFVVNPPDTLTKLRNLISVSPIRPSFGTYLVCNGCVVTKGELSDYHIDSNSIIQLVSLPNSALPSSPSAEEYPSCEPESVLRKIFALPDLPPYDNQVADPSLSETFSRFIDELSRATPRPWTWDSAESRSLVDVSRALSSSNKPDFEVTPFHTIPYPKYGCAALASKQQLLDTVHLSIIGLDQWAFRVHSSYDAMCTRTHTSDASVSAPVSSFVGTVEEQNYEKVIAAVTRLLELAQQRKKNERSAASNQQGHQKTPAMLQAIFTDALKLVDSGSDSGSGLTNPKGGFTDVGLHTGGSARNTVWPLVRSLIQVMLERSGASTLFFKMIMAHFELWLTERQAVSMSADNANPNQTSLVMTMLASSVDWGVTLVQEGHDMGHFEARSAIIRYILEQKAAKRARMISAKYVLSEKKHMSTLDYRNPDIFIPLEQKGDQSVLNIDKCREMAKENLGLILQFPAGMSTWDSVRSWIEHPHSQSRQYLLHSVEHLLFQSSQQLAEEEDVFDSDCLELERMIEAYRIRSRDYQEACKSNKRHCAEMCVELQSREVLAVWIATCLIHKIAVSKCPIVGEYAIALDASNIRYLVLSDISAVNSALRVAEYLRRHSQQKGRIFSLLTGDASFELGLRLSSASAEIRGIVSQEKIYAARRKQSHWDQVQGKKETCQKVQRELRDLEEELSSLKTRFPVCQSCEVSIYYIHTKCREERLAINDVERSIREKMKELQEAEKPPAPVFHPLPQNDENLALQICFFLFMPPFLETLCRMSFTARQMLLPRGSTFVLTDESKRETKVDIEELLASKDQQTDWHHYFNRNSSGYELASARKVPLMSPFRVPTEEEIQPRSVMSFSTPDYGIWSPEELGRVACMRWFGGQFPIDERHGYFNPFSGRIPRAVTIRYFTETFPEEYSLMQPAMPQDDELASLSRGNMYVAELYSKPDWLNKNEYITFGSLRAYPNQQIRKICAVLHDRSLPFHHPAVRILVLQTMYQVGNLSQGSGKIRLLWKTDLDHGDGWKAFENEFGRLGEELCHKPRDHRTMTLLGELCAYASQWSSACRSNARRMASFVQKWASDLRNDIEAAEADSPSAYVALQVKQTIFYMYGIACHAGGELNVADASELCRLILLAKHGQVLVGEETPLHELSCFLASLTKTVISRQFPKLLFIVKSRPEILTSAVSTIIQDAPRDLKWYILDSNTQPTTCYEAVHQNRETGATHLWSVNLLTGCFLYDGKPPGRLPMSILRTALYKRSFGERNFEVATSAYGAQRTTKPVEGGFYYEFSSPQSGRLTALEFDSEHSGVKLELLDPDGIGQWGNDLPKRLRVMHSHWLCRARDVIIVRPRFFLQRCVKFLLVPHDRLSNFGESKAEPAGWVCFRVPKELQELHWTRLMANEEGKKMEQLLVHSQDPTTRTLTKFDDVIHTYAKPSEGKGSFVTYELCRYSLSFTHESGAYVSDNFSGFKLSMKQQFDVSFWPTFVQYLVLENGNSKKIIVPEGTVRRCRDGVEISGSAECDADRRFHTFDVHPRFKTLQATSIAARLQLAAIYTACSSLLPELSCRRTGEELAMELVRRSWTNRPLDEEEHSHLKSIFRMAHSPGLALVCFELEMSANQLDCLYSEKPATAQGLQITDAAIQYTLNKQRSKTCVREELTLLEERRVLGGLVANREVLFRPICGLHVSRNDEFHVTLKNASDESHRLMREALDCLGAMLKKSEAADSIPDFPLTLDHGSQIGRNMMEELRKSWKVYHATPSHDLVEGGGCKISLEDEKDTLFMLNKFEGVLRRIEACRVMLEDKCLDYCANISCTLSSRDNSVFRMRRAANSASYMTQFDLCRAVCDPKVLSAFNPAISDSTQQSFIAGCIRTWLQVCVLEDKLHRLNAFAKNASWDDVKLELGVVRQWSCDEQPEWLVFEAQERLQIRGVQYTVAKYLMQSSNEEIGAVTQLLMGQGKTRIIIPMLLLKSNDHSVLRIHFLSELLDEAHEYLHRCVTAGIVSRKLFKIPYNRQIALTASTVRCIRHSMMYCQESLGAIIVTPEHRLSLYLKETELRLMGCEQRMDKIFGELQEISNIPISDVLDESDEILNHRYQLIYAIGVCKPLPGGPPRWDAVQRLLYHLQFDESVATVLKRRNVCERSSGIQSSQISSRLSFDSIRLIDGDELENVLPDLRKCLAGAVFEDPSYSLRWLRGHALKDGMIRFVTDPGASLQDQEYAFLRDKTQISELALEQLLAMRGLLAFGLFFHCLSRRHRVQFGVDRRLKGFSRQRKVAVPFRANDTPSERAEFAEADTLILYTIISYYRDGLSRPELKEAVTTLLNLDPIAQSEEYAEWLHAPGSSASSIPGALDSVNKLDISSDSCLALASQYFSYNMAAINFWLNYNILPRETMQFPSRILAHPWHLTDNKYRGVIGFSGTSDNKMLLPLHVRQSAPSTPDAISISATDGKMVSMFVEKATKVTCLSEHVSETPTWRLLLQIVVREGAVALIDCGALMVGVSNKDAASELLSLISNEQIRGVVYFETSSGTWVVRNRVGMVTDLHRSPVHERDAFVYFDERRCRGSDMKLRPDAKAAMTVGPGICKDKLMQAGGRMRQLDRHQTLVLVTIPDVEKKIRSANCILDSPTPLLSKHVLKWVLMNTVEAVAHAIPQWASQGAHFCVTKEGIERALMDEKLSLDTYGSPVSTMTIPEIVSASQRRFRAEVSGSQVTLSETLETMLKVIRDRAQELGSEFKLLETGMDEECERELEQERELERELEKQIPSQYPALEEDWQYSTILTSWSPWSLPKEARVIHLSDLASTRLMGLKDQGLSAIRWSKQAFCTRNFADTIQTSTQDGTVGEHLRVVDAILVFSSGEMLLMSEREADQVLELLWEKAHQQKGIDGDVPTFLNLCFLREHYDAEAFGVYSGSAATLQVPGSRAIGEDYSNMDAVLATVQLFNGETMFGTSKRREAVKDLLPTTAGQQAAMMLPALRGRQHRILRSHLESFCKYKNDI